MVRSLQDGEPASSQVPAPPPVTAGLRQGEREARPDLPREALTRRDAEALAAAGDRQYQPAAAVAAVSTDHDQRTYVDRSSAATKVSGMGGVGRENSVALALAYNNKVIYY